ncbi:MAG: DUF5518 domain-containing protein [Methanobacterium sp.]|uniref:DUF5518 domain-containing protein n=1 Tax=Methanobacterium sp. TaxID=2164 RepID=UPI003D645ACC|nr:DUF5518 domain-containing protein [Methanobacterium sp.]
MINLKTILAGIVVIIIFYVLGLGFIGSLIGFFIAGAIIGYLNNENFKNGAINGLIFGFIGFTLVLVIYLIRLAIAGSFSHLSFDSIVILLIDCIMVIFMSIIGALLGTWIGNLIKSRKK